MDELTAKANLVVKKTEHNVEIQLEKIPKRTAVGIAIMGDMEEGKLVAFDIREVRYQCIDCRYMTSDVDIMAEHQRSFKHPLLTRIKRKLSIFKRNMRPLYLQGRVKGNA